MAYSHSGQPRMLLYNFDEHMKAISIDNILIHDLVHGLHTIYIYIICTNPLKPKSRISWNSVAQSRIIYKYKYIYIYM